MKNLIALLFIFSMSNVYSQGTEKNESVSSNFTTVLLNKMEVPFFIDDYDFKSNKIEKIKEIVSSKYSARLLGEEEVLTKNQSRIYNRLSDGDKENIELILNMRMQKMRFSLVSIRRFQDTL